jgi:microcystin-dependent protein
MSQPFVAEIRIFGFNFPPRGWAFCAGQTMSIAQNTALFSLIGTFYGGNGTTTFALPDMGGNVPIGQGSGQGLSPRVLAEASGVDAITLISAEMPAHSHNMVGDSKAFDTDSFSPSGALPANSGALMIYSNSASPQTVSMSPLMVGPTGGSLPHNNLMPYLALNYCICLQGLYPPR